MPHSVEELHALIRTCEKSAESHITYAKRAHTEFQRLFHERRAADDLLRAARHRDELRALTDASTVAASRPGRDGPNAGALAGKR